MVFPVSEARAFSNQTIEPMSDLDAEQMVAWLTQVAYFTESASRDNLNAVRHLAATAPLVQNDLLQSIVQKVGTVSQQGMLSLHREANALLEIPALKRFCGGRVSMSY